MNKLIVCVILLIALSGCKHPLIKASDKMTQTVFPYCEELIEEHEPDKMTKKRVLNAMKAYKRAVKEAKGDD